MIGISNVTLMKPGPLSPAEVDEIREHPWLGERIVAPVPAALRPRPPGDRVPSRAVGRLRLSARPARLEIPLAARIFAVVDAYDAMTNEQPYRDALGEDEARDEIQAKAGLEFDPDVVAAFLTL